MCEFHAFATCSGEIPCARERTRVLPWRKNALNNRLSNIKVSDSLASVGRGPTENQERKNNLKKLMTNSRGFGCCPFAA